MAIFSKTTFRQIRQYVMCRGDEMIHNYYDELFVRVRTQKWTTDWFMFQIGLFQGCPLSVVLFLVVFNLLLDLLKTKQDLGYQLKNSNLKQMQKAYMQMT